MRKSYLDMEKIGELESSFLCFCYHGVVEDGIIKQLRIPISFALFRGSGWRLHYCLELVPLVRSELNQPFIAFCHILRKKKKMKVNKLPNFIPSPFFPKGKSGAHIAAVFMAR